MARIAFTAPHHKASETGLDILRQSGTACEAMVAAAAMIAVQYPHMNSIGGDGFGLLPLKTNRLLLLMRADLRRRVLL